MIPNFFVYVCILCYDRFDIECVWIFFVEMTHDLPGNRIGFIFFRTASLSAVWIQAFGKLLLVVCKFVCQCAHDVNGMTIYDAHSDCVGIVLKLTKCRTFAFGSAVTGPHNLRQLIKFQVTLCNCKKLAHVIHKRFAVYRFTQLCRTTA